MGGVTPKIHEGLTFRKGLLLVTGPYLYTRAPYGKDVAPARMSMRCAWYLELTGDGLTSTLLIPVLYRAVPGDTLPVIPFQGGPNIPSVDPLDGMGRLLFCLLPRGDN